MRKTLPSLPPFKWKTPPPALESQLPEIRRAHEQLIRRYVFLLNEVTGETWLMPPKPQQQISEGLEGLLESLPVEHRPLFDKLDFLADPDSFLARHGKTSALRTLVHLFVEGHVRKKLKELADAYVLIRAQASFDEKELRDWVKDSAEACEKMATTLATWGSTKGIIKIFWPLALSALTAWLGVRDVWEAVGKLNRPALYLLYGVLLLPGMYVWIFLTSAFDYKRQMFLTKLRIKDVSRNPEPKDVRMNVYALEDRLFEILGRAKTPERQWENFFAGFGLCLMSSMFVVALLRGAQPRWPYWLVLALMGVLALWAWLKSEKQEFR